MSATVVSAFNFLLHEGRLAATPVYMVVILTPTQVGLAADTRTENRAFQFASRLEDGTPEHSYPWHRLFDHLFVESLLIPTAKMNPSSLHKLNCSNTGTLHAFCRNRCLGCSKDNSG
jgi:hypothetical protein